MQKGFTLVELAIALMVIGLLIGGVLKGQELIENARVTSTIRHFKDYDSAVMIFNTSYGALPGDIKHVNRVPNCTAAPCNIEGDRNGQVGLVYTSGEPSGFSNESNAFFYHLYAARLISAIKDGSSYSASNKHDGAFPDTPLGSIMTVRYYNYPAGAWTLPRREHQWAITGETAVPRGAGVPLSQIAHLDAKMDDGDPWGGIVVIGTTTCATVGEPTYDMSSEDLCPFLVQTNF